ncbi:hypothetical protein DICPUDRAFT_150858 [Dictyostelium purpureum]|uniref:PA14 domain-containing protein n=1 Tax=Dictyostelium purpureum TaxID=5786 RepID=F0ZHF5_DICPU|nr:uncharacterized protein DICPUDRAFT_150858 [Dictyostelium purpureum]EGC36621.1 hypothetical protein DICPUDRAFT_150858 [Dictyostelium purpureum]|eukprot:XP_003286859.1 hypothetical protein DICPUDRAFT_150858 [Dictyostelium purpureum]
MNYKYILIISLILIINVAFSEITTKKGGAINNAYDSMNKKQKSDAKDAIEGVEYADAFLTKAKSGISKTKLVRVDMQGIFNGDGGVWHNLQAQINGVKKASTVAHVNVCSSLANNKKQEPIIKAIHNALLSSLDDGHSYDYDHSPLRNPDFEVPGTGPPGSVQEGIVLPTLDPITKIPTYCCGDGSIFDLGRLVIHNETTFNQWFVDIPGVNIPFPYELVLTETGVGTGIYEFASTLFFPLNGMGFDNKTEYPNEPVYYDLYGNPEAFHFCMAIHSSFPYNGGEEFRFAGDDDVWIYFNNQLLVDLGSIHPIAEKVVMLDEIQGLIPGNYYDFDMFYCERHTDNSDLIISANFNFVCPWYDACGVCKGRNDTCCKDPCENLNQCSIGTCNVDTNFQCIQEDRDCDDGDQCTTHSCDVDQGCINIPLNCDDGDHCTEDSCDSFLGCVHTEIENCRPCNPGECPTTDLCFPSECNPFEGEKCISREINCTISDPCGIGRCDLGICVIDWICTPTPTESPTVSPTETPTDTPSYEPSYPPPKGLHRNCLKCEDLQCEYNWCTYVKNPKWDTSECNEDCCNFTPTCYTKRRLL